MANKNDYFGRKLLIMSEAKKYPIFAFLCVFFLTSFQELDVNLCTSEEIKELTKKKLDDFTYDTYRSHDFYFNLQKKFTEYEIPLFSYFTYRFLFNIKNLPEDVNIEIYNKPYTAKNRKLVFSTRELKIKSDIIIFSTTEPYRKLFIDYSVLPARGENKYGCLLMMIGYKLGDSNEY